MSDLTEKKKNKTLDRSSQSILLL